MFALPIGQRIVWAPDPWWEPEHGEVGGNDKTGLLILWPDGGQSVVAPDNDGVAEFAAALTVAGRGTIPPDGRPLDTGGRAMAEATDEDVPASYFDPETLGKFLAEDVKGGTPEQRASLFRTLARIPTAYVCGLVRRMAK